MTFVGGRWIGAVLPLLAACAPGPGPVTVTPESIPSLEAERARRPNDRQLIVRLGSAYYREGRFREAANVLRAGVAIAPSFSGAVFLGLSRERLGQLDSAEAAYRVASRLNITAAERTELEARLTNLARARLAADARQAVAQEAALSRAAPVPNAVAVLPWRYLGSNRELAPLEKGIAHLILTDLSQVRSLVLVERERLRALTDELSLSAADRTDPATGARSGRLLKAARVVQGSLRDERGENLRLEASVVSTRTGQLAARGTASDRLASLFAMEKALVLDLLGQLRINLSPAERRAIMERPTADLQAFLAFSRGLDAEDRGDFTAAAEQFRDAAARDPNFTAARDRAAAAVQLGAAADRTPVHLAELADARIPGGRPPAGPGAVVGSGARSIVLQNAIEIVAPSSGALITRRLLTRLPVGGSRLPEALRQDDPTQLAGPRGDIVIVIPRP